MTFRHTHRQTRLPLTQATSHWMGRRMRRPDTETLLVGLSRTHAVFVRRRCMLCRSVCIGARRVERPPRHFATEPRKKPIKTLLDLRRTIPRYPVQKTEFGRGLLRKAASSSSTSCPRRFVRREADLYKGAAPGPVGPAAENAVTGASHLGRLGQAPVAPRGEARPSDLGRSGPDPG